MGLIEGTCDSCSNKVDILFPIGILDELVTGNSKIVQRWYCLECEGIIRAEAEDMEDDDTKEDRKYECGCHFKLISERVLAWRAINVCNDHVFVEGNMVTYKCGCVIKILAIPYYIYVEVCVKHEQ